MKRISSQERSDWKEKADNLGFLFHTMYGEPYWDETAYYSFTLEQIENDIEDPTEALNELCLDVVDRAVRSEELLTKLAIPENMWDLIAESWRKKAPSLYGRFDLCYNGKDPAKMLEFNADTPTSLYESAYFQWLWLEDKIQDGGLPANADQFNSVQEKLIARFADLFEAGSNIHFASCLDTEEDRQTVKYLEDCAAQSGLIPHFVHIEEIGADRFGRLADTKENIIQSLFKLYPWEDMLREEYAKFLPMSDVTFLEPAWKAVLSNKAFLPLIWEFNKGHPNLLPAAFEGDESGADVGSSFVRKPIFSREGANVTVVRDGEILEEGAGEYGEEGFILQSLEPLPCFDGNYTVIGSWIVGDEPAGIALREDRDLVTKDLSRFLPHVIID